MMKKLTAGFGLLMLYLGALLVLLHAVGTSDSLYFRLQVKADVFTEAWVDADELRVIDSQLSAYLKGDASALDTAPFGQDEKKHMEDCYDLFVLLRRGIAVCLIAAAALLLTARLTGLKDMLGCAVAAAGVLLALIAALGIWGLIDFRSLFTLMHKLLFRNGLWLMDPQTELLICICPESMFSTMGALIGAGTAVFIGITIMFCGIFRGRRQ